MGGERVLLCRLALLTSPLQTTPSSTYISRPIIILFQLCPSDCQFRVALAANQLGMFSFTRFIALAASLSCGDIGTWVRGGAPTESSNCCRVEWPMQPAMFYLSSRVC